MPHSNLKSTVSAQVTIVPLSKEQKEYGLRGALEALNLILKTDRSIEEILKLKKSISEQLEEASKGK